MLTEAATGPFCVTPVLAAAGGAEVVYAMARDSVYGTAAEAAGQVRQVAAALGRGEDRIIVVADRGEIRHPIDVVTNAGMVRPIDADLLGKLSHAGAVTVMCEAWELRPGDIDVEYCERHGIPVAGVWEDFGGFNVFRSCGQLALKMCFDAGLEVAGNRLLVVSPDHFGPVIAAALRANGAVATVLASVAELDRAGVAAADGLVLADYTTSSELLSTGNSPSLHELAEWNPGLPVVQFTGSSSGGEMRRAGLRPYPGEELAARRMARTLGHLGPRPVAYLNAMGLKVGELLWRRRLRGDGFGEYTALVQELVPGAARAEAP